MAIMKPVRSSMVVVNPEMHKGEEEGPNNAKLHSQNGGKQSHFQKVEPRRKKTIEKSFVTKTMRITTPRREVKRHQPR